MIVTVSRAILLNGVPNSANQNPEISLSLCMTLVPTSYKKNNLESLVSRISQERQNVHGGNNNNSLIFLPALSAGRSAFIVVLILSP